MFLTNNWNFKRVLRSFFVEIDRTEDTSSKHRCARLFILKWPNKNLSSHNIVAASLACHLLFKEWRMKVKVNDAIKCNFVLYDQHFEIKIPLFDGTWSVSKLHYSQNEIYIESHIRFLSGFETIDFNISQSPDNLIFWEFLRRWLKFWRPDALWITISMPNSSKVINRYVKSSSLHVFI